MELFTYAERPDLSERLGEVEDTLKPFLGHGNVALEHWHKLRPEHPELQLVLYDDENDVVVGHARTLPTREAEGLPNGIDGVLELWFGEKPRPEPDTLSAMVAVVDRGHGGRGLSQLLITGMRDLAAREGFASLVAPLRPTWKERYPLIPMDRYVRWTGDDGLPFDPWLRVHARLGAELLEVCDASYTVEASREDWQEWTDMRFPDDGEYIVPGALTPVRFSGGRGLYVEPNVWTRHRV
jgi:hypothetical protein